LKKLLTIIAVGLMGITASAGVNPWTVVSDFTDSANNNEEFFVLQANYPKYFSGVDPTNVSSAKIRIINLQFDGLTTCAINDPRLRAEVASTEICFNSTNDGPAMNCMASMMSWPGPFDPCL
jgi:hypothetical protein